MRISLCYCKICNNTYPLVIYWPAIPDVEIKRGMGYSKGKATRGGISDGEQEAVICRQSAKDNSGEI